MKKIITWPWLLGFFVLAMACWGVRPLWEPDEGRYAETAREFLNPVDVSDLTTSTAPLRWRLDLGKDQEKRLAWDMLQVGTRRDWLIPRLQGQPHLTKPPFTYWITAMGMMLFGINEWGARFFVGLAFFGIIICTVGLARTWGRNDKEARAAGLIFGTSVLPFVAGHLLTTDIFLAFWETLGVLACWRVWRDETKAFHWRWLFWFAFGMAFLTKGPPGWLPLAVIAVFFWLRRKNWTLPGKIWSWPGLALMLIVALSWFVAISMRQPSLFMHFIKYEFLERVASTVHRRNNPVWIYIPVMLIGLFPWVGLWPMMLKRAWLGLRIGWENWKEVELFTAIWLGLPLIVFTLSQSRMILYVLPIFVPLAIWAARSWLRLWGGNILPLASFARGWTIAGAIVWAIVLLIFINYPSMAPFSRTQKPLALQLLKIDPTHRYQLFSEDDSGHTLSFYTGRRLIQIDRKLKDQLKIIRKESRAGRPAALVLSRRRFKRIKPGEGLFQVLAQSKGDIIITPAP